MEIVKYYKKTIYGTKTQCHNPCHIPHGEQCPICMDDITELTGFVQTPCGHKFGADCFIAYLATYNSMHGSASSTMPTCPMCRQDLTLPHTTQYVVLPHNPNAECNSKCGHCAHYETIMRISRLEPGESVKCQDDKGESESYYQYVIYQRPRIGQAREEVSPDVRLQLFAQTYNALRIMGGMGGLSYAT